MLRLLGKNHAGYIGPSYALPVFQLLHRLHKLQRPIIVDLQGELTHMLE